MHPEVNNIQFRFFFVSQQNGEGKKAIYISFFVFVSVLCIYIILGEKKEKCFAKLQRKRFEDFSLISIHIFFCVCLSVRTKDIYKN